MLFRSGSPQKQRNSRKPIPTSKSTSTIRPTQPPICVLDKFTAKIIASVQVFLYEQPFGKSGIFYMENYLVRFYLKHVCFFTDMLNDLHTTKRNPTKNSGLLPLPGNNRCYHQKLFTLSVISICTVFSVIMFILK